MYIVRRRHCGACLLSLCANQARSILDNALLQQAELSRLHQPSQHNLEVIRKWLQLPEYGNFFLRGTEASVWDDPYSTDLVALSDSQQEQDLFSRWYRYKFLAFFHQCVGYRFRVILPVGHHILR